MAVKRRNKSVYISVYSYIIPAFWLKNPVFPGVFVSMINYEKGGEKRDHQKTALSFQHPDDYHSGVPLRSGAGGRTVPLFRDGLPPCGIPAGVSRGAGGNPV